MVTRKKVHTTKQSACYSLLFEKRKFSGGVFLQCVQLIHPFYLTETVSIVFPYTDLRYTLYTLVMVISTFYRNNCEIHEFRRSFKCSSIF